MKKTLCIFGLGTMLLSLFACSGKGKYAEAKTLLDKQVAVMEDYVSSLEKATSGADVAAAITRYGEATRDLMPQMNALAGKYPDLKNEKEPPAELKPSLDKLKDLGMRMAQASMKSMQYMNDPAVQEAQKKMAESLSSSK